MYDEVLYLKLSPAENKNKCQVLNVCMLFLDNWNIVPQFTIVFLIIWIIYFYFSHKWSMIYNSNPFDDTVWVLGIFYK